MNEERMTREEWEKAERDAEEARKRHAAIQARVEKDARKAHERTDLTDAELASMTQYHFDVEQWSCSSCWHGRTCDTGRLIREVQRRRKAEA